ncbi:hypothetical protein YC2023_015806 [Brassica napus]
MDQEETEALQNRMKLYVPFLRVLIVEFIALEHLRIADLCLIISTAVRPRVCGACSVMTLSFPLFHT